MEIWTCSNPGCGFILPIAAMSAIPAECPRCKGQSWNIEETDSRYCRVRGAIKSHDWSEGQDAEGLPLPIPGNYCRACGMSPVWSHQA